MMRGPFGLGVIVTSLMAANIAGLTGAILILVAAAAYGFNVGLGLLGRASPTLGARIDYTHHTFVGGGMMLPVSSLTIGFVWMH